MNRPGAYAFFLALAAATLPLFALPAQEYSKMAPLAQYLMDPSAEMALAQTAAPPSISKDATVLVLAAHGYVVGKRGSNGFTCIVERGWMPPFDQKDFWSTTLRAPICYNAPASRTVLQYTLRRTMLALAGLSRMQIYNRINAMPLPTPAPGSMSYMLSKQQNLGQGVGSWMPHVMFHVPKSYAVGDGAIWGADLPGSPIVFDNGHHLTPEPQTILMVPVSKWSDGSSAPSM
ncbi:MAG: hypothetical protein JO302_04800 [Candidatus Eremiobacteraeota bacterium]|nr:hypothetical protein [Candidatus Eremiobacteraeota bacterium]